MEPLTLEKVILLVRDFLVVWISQILYYNHIYPDESYEERSYMENVVFQTRVPALAEYLTSFANQMIKVLVEKDGGGKVHEIIVLIYDEASLHVRKRYIANFSQFVGLAGHFTSLDFLNGLLDAKLARLNLPDLTWPHLFTDLRSLMFFHIQELKRSELKMEPNVFFKLLLNMDGSVNLSLSENNVWAKITLADDQRPMKYVPLGETSVGFVCFDIHNEYIP